jgi:hypothetical protein
MALTEILPGVTNNQIIQEYLGWKLINLTEEDRLIDPDYDESDECWVFYKNPDETGMSTTSYSGGDCEILNKDSELPYDSDWNWFMECVLKINEDLKEYKIGYANSMMVSFVGMRRSLFNADIKEANKYAVQVINELNRIKNETKG